MHATCRNMHHVTNTLRHNTRYIMITPYTHHVLTLIASAQYIVMLHYTHRVMVSSHLFLVSVPFVDNNTLHRLRYTAQLDDNAHLPHSL